MSKNFKENRYKMYVMNNKEYILDDEDIQKLEKYAGEMLVRLKQVMVHPPNIIAIEAYEVYGREVAVEKESGAVVRELMPPVPVQDVFKRKVEVLKLSQKNNR